MASGYRTEPHGCRERRNMQGDPENASALGFAEILVVGLRLKIGMELGFGRRGRVKSILPRSRGQRSPKLTTGLKEYLRKKEKKVLT